MSLRREGQWPSDRKEASLRREGEEPQEGLLDLAGTTGAGDSTELVGVGVLLAGEVYALPVNGLIRLLEDFEEVQVVDALQYVHRLVDVATIVVVSELLDTAHDVSLGSEVLDLILELGGEDATYVFALELGSVAGEVLLDVLVDGVVR